MKKAVLVGILLLAVGVVNAQYTFSNPDPISIPSSGPATPYPSPISVSGLPGDILSVTVTFKELSHTWPRDIDALLVGPTGVSCVLMSDAAGSSPGVSGVTYIFDDAAAAMLPDNSNPPSGTYKPSNYGATDTWPAPAPAGPYGALLGGFAGTNGNGDWNLYIVDDLGGDSGSMAGGWELAINAVPEPASVVLLAIGMFLRRR